METTQKAVVNGSVKKELKPLPKYQDLVNMDYVDSVANEFQVFVNQNPLPEWIKTNTIANNSKYIPIDKIEYLLTRIFIKWWVEVKDFKIVANSICVSIRLHYVLPYSGEHMFQDGLGAAPLQTDKDKGAIDFNYIKNAAVQMALPSAESYAIKDAAEKIGRIFGKDLNRKDLMAYDNLAGRFESKSPDQIAESRLIEIIQLAANKEDLMKQKKHIKPEWSNAKEWYNEKLNSFK